ncbi:hypothetical protein [Ichthyenterobacterium magnum]|uniref:Uncharacterized protein n=1 Tax=Ichthyenterobacterium magnum TaxID=1230530 RepID=A0A420DL51_9FLAO|nr:hypothetical protein [Ichthyenterobacterium magnum]RKE94994.1 hypothetical protein BXY80_2012 [Ichthyenterobacterium magnum]
MTSKLNKTTYLIIIAFLMFSSCRKEEMELIQAPDEDTVEANSNIASLLQRTALNDGSEDNIIDSANCLNVKLPTTVTANNEELIINSSSDYYSIEYIFDETDDDVDVLDIQFPITIIQADFTEIVINSITALHNYASNCNGENEIDDDIECIDFQYPFSASVFDINTELFSTETFTNDNQLYTFITTINDSNIVTLNFPITLIHSDQSQVIVNTLNELESSIENAQNNCNEDDDYDYNDDDCNTCTPSQIEAILINCPNWHVDKLKRNDTNYDSAYEGYDFNFFNDGTLSVFWSSITVYGTWIISGTGNNITVIIDIPSLPLCNNNWRLQEAGENNDESRINFVVGDNDRLRYRNNCN